MIKHSFAPPLLEDFQESSQAAGNPVIGNEPEIDLGHFYSGENDPRFAADLAELTGKTAAFAEKYRGKLATLDADGLAECIEEKDALNALSIKIGVMAFMPMAKDVNRFGAFYNSLSAKLLPLQNDLIFFPLELGKLPEADIQAKMAQSSRLERYRIVLEGAVAEHSHMLTEDQEKIANIKDLTGDDWIHLFDNLMPNIKYPFEGKELNSTALTTIMAYDTDRDRRQRAYETFLSVLNQPSNRITLAAITNARAQFIAEDDKLRGYEHPDSRRNLGEGVSDADIENLNDAIRNAYARTSHRFYELKRQMLGYDKLKPWDRNALISTEKAAPLAFSDALEQVIEAYSEFSPALGNRIRELADGGRIDARLTDGKRPGAFAEGIALMEPFMHISWQGRGSDIKTLAHELGHNMQQDRSAKGQKSEMLMQMPMVLAEIPSTFGEAILFAHRLAQEPDVTKRKLMLAEEIDAQINTIVRQMAFHNFELLVHNGRREKGRELTVEELNQFYLDTQKEALGPAFDFDDKYGYSWAYIPHFVHSPFYVRAYAFSKLASNTMFHQYEEATDKPAAVKQYLDFLDKGGSRKPAEALKPWMDLRDPNCWEGGIKVLEELIDRLEAEMKLEAQLKPKAGQTGPAPGGP